MNRLYEDAAYGPRVGCYWDDTVVPAPRAKISADRTCDVAIVGGGFTGLNAALRLAEAGADAVILEAEQAGFGASGRNGGFCCLGGSKATHGMLRRRYGNDGLAAWTATERAAIDHVETLIADHALDVDRHSDGEVLLAHTPRAWRAIQNEVDEVAATYGAAPTLIPREELAQHGLGGDWHGALQTPFGFALNPAKYLDGLTKVATDAGANLFSESPVTSITRAVGGWRLETAQGAVVTAKSVLIATNGYSSEDLPPWLSGRTLPVQSSILVTRPLTMDERIAQGWTSHQMSYDTRTLLHYFRLMPNGRFLFGMRGGLRATPRAMAETSRRIRTNFARLFPAWRSVEITHEWSGLVCLMPKLVPFVGPVPDHPGLFAALGYHGNGVAMASYAGTRAADMILERAPGGPVPPAFRDTPPRFPLGRFRRMLLWPAYNLAEAFDL